MKVGDLFTVGRTESVLGRLGFATLGRYLRCLATAAQPHRLRHDPLNWVLIADKGEGGKFFNGTI